MFVEPTQHCVLGYFQPSLSGLSLQTGSQTGYETLEDVLSGATHSPGYFLQESENHHQNKNDQKEGVNHEQDRQHLLQFARSRRNYRRG